MRQGNCTDPYAGIKIHWPQIKTVCSNGLLNDRLMQTEYKDFAPRIGISYSPDSKWVVRAGFGLFYNQDIGNAIFDMARNIAGRIRVNSNVGTPTIFWNNALARRNGAKAQMPSPFAFVAAYSHRTSYTMEYLLNVQRQLCGNWVVEAGYLGSLSRHLYGFQDANQPIPGTVGSALSRTPFSNFGVIQLVDDGANGNYNAGSVKVTKRFSAGLSLISSYTYAKSIDNTSGIRVQGYDTLFPQNSDCLECERGLSSFDARHRFVTSVLYDLPVGKGRALNVTNPVANAVVGGWQLGGIWTAQSGLPQVITIGGVDRSATGVGYDRPNATGEQRIRSSPTPSRWYDPAAFVEAPGGHLRQRRTQYAGRTRHLRARFRRAQGIPHALQRRPRSAIPLRGVQRDEPPVWGESERQHPGRRGIPGPAVDQCPPGLRRDHGHGGPDAPGAAGIEVLVLSTRAPRVQK